MHPQLEAITRELKDASERLEIIAGSASEEQLQKRPPQGGWSAAECIVHLNLTSRGVLAKLDEALARKPSSNRLPVRMRRDLIGWLIWRSVGPDAKMKASTSPAFVPGGGQTGEEILEEFRELQAVLLDRLRRAEAWPLHRIKIASPFSERIRYSIFSAFSILAAHEHRHLGQAERALAAAPR